MMNQEGPNTQYLHFNINLQLIMMVQAEEQYAIFLHFSGSEARVQITMTSRLLGSLCQFFSAYFNCFWLALFLRGWRNQCLLVFWSTNYPNPV